MTEDAEREAACANMDELIVRETNQSVDANANANASVNAKAVAQAAQAANRRLPANTARGRRVRLANVVKQTIDPRRPLALVLCAGRPNKTLCGQFDRSSEQLPANTNINALLIRNQKMRP